MRNTAEDLMVSSRSLIWPRAQRRRAAPALGGAAAGAAAGRTGSGGDGARFHALGWASDAILDRDQGSAADARAGRAAAHAVPAKFGENHDIWAWTV